MIKFKKTNVIDCHDLDELVMKTYGRQYCFQQQDGCQPRGHVNITVPEGDWDYENDTIPEVVNGDQMGVSFKSWLERDPKQLLEGDDSEFSLKLWWDRNFYPSLSMVINDLHSKGLIPEGEYVIKIDW
ncbi:hypothetical protein Va1_143 [Vibrio phage Va1]|nr:hypothetical protein Va1_143 [Vibrio phage Va1]